MLTNARAPLIFSGATIYQHVISSSHVASLLFNTSSILTFLEMSAFPYQKARWGKRGLLKKRLGWVAPACVRALCMLVSIRICVNAFSFYQFVGWPYNSSIKVFGWSSRGLIFFLYQECASCMTLKSK